MARALADGDLDAASFDSLVADGRRALADGDPFRAAALLTAGLGLWRGGFLEDVPQTQFITTQTERALEHRLSATELWARAVIDCGRPDEAIADLRALVGEHPLREGLWLLLMHALDAAGRRAEALDTYSQAREVIADELGVDPGRDLQQLHADLLAADAGEVQAALNIADAYYQLEGPQAALKHMVESLEVVRGTGRSSRYAAALNNLGEVYLELGRLGEAAASFAEVMDVARDVGEAYVQGHATHNLGRAYLGMDRPDEARDAIRQAIAIHRSTGDQAGEAIALRYLGRAQRALDEIAEARASWSAALRILTLLGDSDQAAQVEAEIASLAPAR